MPQPTGQGFVTPQRQMILCRNLFQTPNTLNQSVQITPTGENQNVQRTPATQGEMPVKSGKICFNCGKPGHFALQCPDPRQPSTPTQGTTAPPNRNRSSTLT
jgi:hypothetical protein